MIFPPTPERRSGDSNPYAKELAFFHVMRAMQRVFAEPSFEHTSLDGRFSRHWRIG